MGFTTPFFLVNNYKEKKGAFMPGRKKTKHTVKTTSKKSSSSFWSRLFGDDHAHTKKRSRKK